MKENKYEVKASEILKVIEIAIKSFKHYPPKMWDEKTLNSVINCHKQWANGIVNAKPQFRNLTSLKYDIDAVFTYFQESGGQEVNYFWDKIREENLPYKRENKMLKILKRKKINSDIEYNFVIDVMMPYLDEKLIDEVELALLNGYLTNFENKSKK
jgi:hypothetical protein